MPVLESLSTDLADAVERAAPATVAVHARPRLPSTGVHWRAGVVVTADHAVRTDDDIAVSWPDRGRVPARIAGRDPGTDLAVLRVEDTGLPTAPVADAGALRAGHIVLALGHGPRVGWGVVSTLAPWPGRARAAREHLIRLDLVLYPGFSGGPLVDSSGRVVGITTSGLSRSGPVAIPAATVSVVVDELLRRGRVARGYLGVGLHPVRLPPAAGTAGETGLIVVNVEPDGPAGRAGILIGDILLALEGTPVRDLEDIQSVLGPERVGSALTAEIIRAGVASRVTITVGERPQRRR